MSERPPCPRLPAPRKPGEGLAYFDETAERWRCIHCNVVLDADGECQCEDEDEQVEESA